MIEKCGTNLFEFESKKCILYEKKFLTNHILKYMF